MVKLNSIKTTQLQNAAHMEFINQVTAKAGEIAAFPTVTSARQALERLQAARDAEDANFKMSQKSDYTADINAADKERDLAYTTFKKSVDAFRNFPDESLSAAAKKVWEKIKLYKINVNMRLDNETALIDNLVQDLGSELSAEVATLNLTSVVTSMNSANSRVRELTSAQTQEKGSRVAGALKASRVESDAALKEVLLGITSMAFVFGDADYVEFAQFYNALVERYKKQIASGSSKPVVDEEEDVAE